MQFGFKEHSSTTKCTFALTETVNYFSKNSTTNGVKQGGVLSPRLFSVYIDELLTRLKHSGYGCMVGHV